MRARFPLKSTKLALVFSSWNFQASFGPFGYNPPTITSVLPAAGPTSGNLRITVAGDSFGTGATVQVAIGGIDWFVFALVKLNLGFCFKI